MPFLIAPPIEPMLAKLSHQVPEGPFLFEPKWDGFRALVFRDGDDVYVQSRDLKPLARYFPELLGPLRASLPARAVVDGEIVIARGDALDFEALLERIHPAASRVELLSRETPASFVAFDLLASEEGDLRALPQKERRARLEAALAGARPPIHLTPMTRDRANAEDWFHRFEGAGLDGVVAKHEDLAYAPGKRAMIKVKHERTADCVVGGFRWFKGGKGTLVGSLMLGLYDAAGALHHVGICASFTRERRVELAKELEPLRENAREGHPWSAWSAAAPDDKHPTRKPGAQSRWSHGKDLSWEPIRIERACEVAYDHMQGARFRHAAHFKRWRPDKPLAECTYRSLEVATPFELAQIFKR